jgi:predicted nucleotide-binding protein (sugar kinase/HSP70/actin superfamily)
LKQVSKIDDSKFKKNILVAGMPYKKNPNINLEINAETLKP